MRLTGTLCCSRCVVMKQVCEAWLVQALVPFQRYQVVKILTHAIVRPVSFFL